MASFYPSRRPLTSRLLPNSPGPGKTRAVSGSKRPRSPDHEIFNIQPIMKRARPTPAMMQDLQREKKAEREQREAEFREKYTRAFPTWKFYFDTEKPLSVSESNLITRVLQLRAKVVDFFDATVTHVISDADLPQPNMPVNNKENNPCDKPASRKSINTNRTKEEKKNVAIQQALASGMKIWNATKLDSVLSRCLHVPEQMSASQRPSLSRLLQVEKIHGTTERDPTQKRYNYQYFNPGTCFVLLEDISQELATIAAHEYPVIKDKNPNSKKPWPVLHCHPHSRNPFAPFDEKERRRWERQQQAEKDEEEERARRQRQRQLEAIRRRAETRKKGDLRRTVSFGNIQRKFQMDDCVDLDADGDDFESANASGYLASGVGAEYVAASGNSVGVTSTTGTTSTSAQAFRNFRLPASMNERIKHQVVTNLKVSAKDSATGARLMGPPAPPSKRQALLKRSKSTNTIKLPKRDEGVKPGYCESCRIKFSDFTEHVESKKHIKFASTSANFEAVDYVLDRLKRKTWSEVEDQERVRLAKLKARWMKSSFIDPSSWSLGHI